MSAGLYTQPGPLRVVPSSPREEDLRLARMAAAGDEAAQRKVVQMLLGRVRSVIGYAVNDPVWTEDLGQTAMLKILSSLDDYRGESSLSFWSTRIALRIAMKAMRTRRRRGQLLFFLPEPASPFEDADAHAEIQQLRRQINLLVSKLSEPQQVAIRLRYVQGHSIGEIAEITETSANTVRDRLQTGKKKLKKLLDKNPGLSKWIVRKTHGIDESRK